MLILTSSHRIMWCKKLIKGVAEMVEPYKEELWPLYFEIFTATKKKTRVAFFQEQLVKVLWKRFLTEKEAEIEKRVAQARDEYSDMP